MVYIRRTVKNETNTKYRKGLNLKLDYDMQKLKLQLFRKITNRKTFNLYYSSPIGT